MEEIVGSIPTRSIESHNHAERSPVKL